MTRALAEEELAALYRDADVALVLPLRSAGTQHSLNGFKPSLILYRDGMNLTGKEFVSCRIYRGKPGVLLLSPFIGAAEIMQVGRGVSSQTVRSCDAGGAHCQPVRGVQGGRLPPQVTRQYNHKLDLP